MSQSDGSIVDKIKGMIFGHALGDAVGLITEFKFKCDRIDITFPYKEQIRRFPICDWTDDTDHLVLVIMSLIENDMNLNECDIAKKIYNWSKDGFPELGDTVGEGLGGSINMVINHDTFLTDPVQASRMIWHNSGKKLAANGSMMRTSIIGTYPGQM